MSAAVHLTFNAVATLAGDWQSDAEAGATKDHTACTWAHEMSAGRVTWLDVDLNPKHALGRVTCPHCLVLLDEALSVTEAAS